MVGFAAILLVACAGPAPRQQEVQHEAARGPVVVTTMGITEFLSRELLQGVAETRLLGPQVPRERRAEPSPDELVTIARASIVVAYGGAVDSNAIEMVRAEAPDLPILIVRETAPANSFAWLDAATMREDAASLHEMLSARFDTSNQRSRLDANLASLDERLGELHGAMADYREVFSGQRVFTDDRRIHGFLQSLGMSVIDTVELGANGVVDEAQTERVMALAAGASTRILIVTHPEKKERLADLARDADLTLVYFNPFLDGGTGIGSIDTVIPRQLSVLHLALNSAMAANVQE